MPAIKAYKNNPDVAFAEQLQDFKVTIVPAKPSNKSEPSALLAHSERNDFLIRIDSIPADFSRQLLVNAMNEKYPYDPENDSRFKKQDFKEPEILIPADRFKEIHFPLSQFLYTRNLQPARGFAG